MHSLTNQYKFSDLNEYLIDKKKRRFCLLPDKSYPSDTWDKRKLLDTSLQPWEGESKMPCIETGMLLWCFEYQDSILFKLGTSHMGDNVNDINHSSIELSINLITLSNFILIDYGANTIYCNLADLETEIGMD